MTYTKARRPGVAGSLSIMAMCSSLSAGDPGQPVVVPFPDERLAVHGLSWFAENNRQTMRLPVRLKDTFRTAVWNLAQHTSGVRIRLRTNSPTIQIEATAGTAQAHHMTSVMKNGLDVYVNGLYKGSAWPAADGKIKRSFGPLGPADAFRDITVHFPLYNSIRIEQIVLAPGAGVQAPAPFALPNPVVYYGSSITQGGCASNPGLSYQAILARRLNVDFVNLGFSGNGLGDPAVARAAAGIEAAAFVLDYWANPDPETYERTLPEFVTILRDTHPTTPILVTGPYFCPFREAVQARKRDIATRFVSARRDAGDTHIHYVEGLDLISPETAWGLVDGRHANSLGFFLCANGLEPHLRRVLRLDQHEGKNP